VTEDQYTYSARVLRVIDGDTLEVEVVKSKTIDWGFRVKTEHGFAHKLKVRLYGLNTPETRGPKAKVEGEAGKAATVFVEEWLHTHCASDSEGHSLIRLRSHDGRALAPGKYHGRWIAEVWDRLGVKSLNEALITSGHAEVVEY
jgi:endonuclease YncB( thermonuclease family)